MDIVQEVSSIAPGIQASDVVTNKREIETSVITRDGGVVVLGGLISNTGSANVAQVPLLGDIPLLGNLFKYSRNETEKQNLMIFIRARVIRSGEQMDVATGEKYRYMRAQQLLAGFEEGQLLDQWAEPANSETAGHAFDAEGSVIQASAGEWLFPSQRSRLGSLAR
jgi:general secretion pathway protein D